MYFTPSDFSEEAKLTNLIPHFKRYDRKLVAYYEKQLQLLGVDVRFNTTVSKDDIDNYKADVVVTATGSTPKKISINGTQETVTADQVLLGKVAVEDNVVIIGGGLVGCETGLWLAQKGKKVSIVKILPEILGGHDALPHMNYDMLVDLLKFNNIDVYKNASVFNTKEGQVEVNQNGESFNIAADTIIASVGYKENNSLYNELKDLNIPVYNIGDSSKVHNIMYSIWNAYELGRNL